MTVKLLMHLLMPGELLLKYKKESLIQRIIHKEVAAQVREQLNENALNGDGHIDVVFGTTACPSCFDENERPAQVIALSYPREKP